jgi:hypothetical protein
MQANVDELRNVATIYEPARETPVANIVDVVVAGGGTAGVVSAIASARNGAKTLLLERSGFLGGHIAGQLLEHSAGWHDTKGDQIVAGIPQEIVDRLVEIGASPGHVRDDTGYTKFRVPIHHEEFKSLVTLMLAESGVKILVYSPLVQALVEDGVVKGVVVENKSGRQAFLAKVVVDCTGDADVAVLASARFYKGGEDDGLLQPVSLLFKLGGIDFSQLIGYVERNPDEFKLGVSADILKDGDYINLWGFGALLEKGYVDGVLSLKRKEMHFAGWLRTGEAVINVTRYAADGTNVEELSQAEIVLRRQVLEFVQLFRRYVPGCAHSYLSASASGVGVRETRRIVGIYQLSEDDVVTGRRFSDAIAQGGFPIDSHDPLGISMEATEQIQTAYDIPYRCLVPADVDGLIVAGRCISASRRALASARITGTVMAMGQASGTAAALCAQGDILPRDLNIASLQSKLINQGALLPSVRQLKPS